MTIDYLKWDNMDTDSEPESSPPSVPTPQAPTPGSIQAVIVRRDERIRFAHWSVTMIQVDHPVFSNYILVLKMIN
ncbi:hypothetical protein B0T10DRAFT_43937 [Thelonectria olida]|uniref:Uncharacterized protein n=1 Tax=Thelonectria olida TaxID=1576542 RepID=A0A9P8W4J9_9HYPO|nr:hypothetical protein B0T10DRAFT_43937 [Thelonectria olida]